MSKILPQETRSSTFATQRFSQRTPRKTLMLKVGLTGSIAVGKSFVLGVLSELGCRIIDADAVARQVVLPGSPGLRAVIEAFGEEVLKRDGSLDRAKLGEI